MNPDYKLTHGTFPSKETFFNRDMRALWEGVPADVQDRASSKSRRKRPVGLASRLKKGSKDADGGDRALYSQRVPAIGDGVDGEGPQAEQICRELNATSLKKTRTLHWLRHPEHRDRMIWLLFWHFLPDDAAKEESQPPAWLVDIVELVRTVMVDGRERYWGGEAMYWPYFRDRPRPQTARMALMAVCSASIAIGCPGAILALQEVQIFLLQCGSWDLWFDLTSEADLSRVLDVDGADLYGLRAAGLSVAAGGSPEMSYARPAGSSGGAYRGTVSQVIATKFGPRDGMPAIDDLDKLRDRIRLPFGMPNGYDPRSESTHGGGLPSVHSLAVGTPHPFMVDQNLINELVDPSSADIPTQRTHGDGAL